MFCFKHTCFGTPSPQRQGEGGARREYPRVLSHKDQSAVVQLFPAWHRWRGARGAGATTTATEQPRAGCAHMNHVDSGTAACARGCGGLGPGWPRDWRRGGGQESERRAGLCARSAARRGGEGRHRRLRRAQARGVARRQLRRARRVQRAAARLGRGALGGPDLGHQLAHAERLLHGLAAADVGLRPGAGGRVGGRQSAAEISERGRRGRRSTRQESRSCWCCVSQRWERGSTSRLSS